MRKRKEVLEPPRQPDPTNMPKVIFLSRRARGYSIKFPDGRKIFLNRNNPSVRLNDPKDLEFVMENCKGVGIREMTDHEFKQYAYDILIPLADVLLNPKQAERFKWTTEQEKYIKELLDERGITHKPKAKEPANETAKPPTEKSSVTPKPEKPKTKNKTIKKTPKTTSKSKKAPVPKAAPGKKKKTQRKPAKRRPIAPRKRVK